MMDRMKVLELIESGDLNVEQGLNLLEHLSEDGELDEENSTIDPSVNYELPEFPEVLAQKSLGIEEDGRQASELVEQIFSDPEIVIKNVRRHSDKPTNQPIVMPKAAAIWRRWWILPVCVGILLTVTGGMLMAQAQQTSGISIWFFLAGVPFILGLMLIILGFESHSWPWLYLSIKQSTHDWPERITFSMPIPLRPLGRLLNRFGRHIPKRQQRNVDSLKRAIRAIGNTIDPENPIFIEVQDNHDGDRVEIYIG